MNKSTLDRIVERFTRGREIHHFRKQYKITQGKLAKKMHVSDRAIRWWESGRSRPHDIIWERFMIVKKREEKRYG